MRIPPQGRIVLLVLTAGLLATTAAACGGSDSSSTTSASGATTASASLSGELAGAGATSQQAAQEAWIAGFQEANSGVTIAYDPVGSGGGREQFTAGGVAFAGSDAALDSDELTKSESVCGGPDNVVEVPNYVSPIAIIYNVSGVDSLQLSPDTLANIFAQKIKKWNDPAIAADNPGVDLPDTNITPVNRSDESGTTENFTDYLSQASPSIWTYEVSGDWPVKGGEAAEGTSGVVDAVKNGDGTIGYADASQAGDLGVAKIKVGSEFVEPSAEAAAKIFDESTPDSNPGANEFTYKLNRTPDASDTYPIVLVSYLIGCTKYDDPNTAALVKAYFSYIISADGQQTAASAAGSAPLSDSVRQKIQAAVDAIGSGA
ncbi:MAG TPA: phosphate ABC transporter substrate-binding protein PstS [Gaiellaceae bacterium]